MENIVNELKEISEDMKTYIETIDNNDDFTYDTVLGWYHDLTEAIMKMKLGTDKRESNIVYGKIAMEIAG